MSIVTVFVHIVSPWIKTFVLVKYVMDVDNTFFFLSFKQNAQTTKHYRILQGLLTMMDFSLAVIHGLLVFKQGGIGWSKISFCSKKLQTLKV